MFEEHAKNLLVLGTVAAAACASVPAGGSDENPRAVQPERPTVATHDGTVARGYAEVESGVERDRLDDGTHALSVPSVLKLGLVPRTQLSLTLPLYRAPGVPFGAGDAAVGVKWRFVENHPLLQDVAVLPQVKLATGGVRGTGTTDASLLLIDSHTFGSVALDVNVGVTRRSGDGTRAPRSATLWTVSSGLPVRGPLGWALEVYGYPGTSGPAGAPPIVALLAGPTLAVRPTLALDVGFITPLAGPQPHALYAGLVTNFGRVWR